MKHFVRLIVYALAVMAVGDYPSYDWRDAIAKLVSAGNMFTPVAHSIAAPNVYSPQGGGMPVLPPPPKGAGPGRYNLPDYESLIRGDSGYIGATGAVDAAENSIGEQRRNAIRSALVQFGAVPQGWQSGYGDADPAALAAAAANPFSTSAMLSDARSRGSADLAAALGSRGMLSSGALTGGEQLLQHQYDKSLSDATNALLQALGGDESSYAGAFQGLEGQRLGAYGDAASRVAQLYPAQWIPDFNASGPDPGTLQPNPADVATGNTIPWQAAVTGPVTGNAPGGGIAPNPPGAITPDMVAPPGVVPTVQPPRRTRRFGMTDSYTR